MNARVGIVLTGILLVVGSVVGQVRSERDTAVVQRESADEVLRAEWAGKWKAELNDNAAAWDAWRGDFRDALKANEDYAAAVRAVESYKKSPFFAFDEDEYAARIKTRDDAYRTLALAVYEEHFGQWTGDRAEFDVVVQLAAPGPIRECTQAAKDTCGTSGAKSVKVSVDGSGGSSCEFSCKDTQ